MNKTLRRIAGCAALAAAGATLPALADSTWELVSLMPFPVDGGASSGWQAESLESLYQTGGGFAAEGREAEQPVATEPTQGQAAFRMEHASWGFGVSELRSDFNLGPDDTLRNKDELWRRVAWETLACFGSAAIWRKML